MALSSDLTDAGRGLPRRGPASCRAVARRLAFALATALPLAAPLSPLHAQTTGSIELELNTALDVPEGCRLTYVATNGSSVALDKASYEIAAFDDKGAVASILVLEFGSLPLGKTRVVQFDLPEMTCGTISRLLVNNQRDCTGADGSAQDICIKSLAASSRLPNIRFGL